MYVNVWKCYVIIIASYTIISKGAKPFMMMKKKNNNSKKTVYKKKGCCHHTVLTVDAVWLSWLSSCRQSISPLHATSLVCPKHFACHHITHFSIITQIEWWNRFSTTHHTCTPQYTIYTIHSSRNNYMNMQYVG